jgi:hypothetical protein
MGRINIICRPAPSNIIPVTMTFWLDIIHFLLFNYHFSVSKHKAMKIIKFTNYVSETAYAFVFRENGTYFMGKVILIWPSKLGTQELKNDLPNAHQEIVSSSGKSMF